MSTSRVFLDPSILERNYIMATLIVITTHAKRPVLEFYWSDQVLDEFWRRKGRTDRAGRERKEYEETFPEASIWGSGDTPAIVPKSPLVDHIVAAVTASESAWLLTEEPHFYRGFEAKVAIISTDEFLTTKLHRDMPVIRSAMRHLRFFIAPEVAIGLPRFWQCLQ